MTEWSWSKDNLLSELKNLGFPEELGNEIAKNLGSPKAMDRMAESRRPSSHLGAESSSSRPCSAYIG